MTVTVTVTAHAIRHDRSETPDADIRERWERKLEKLGDMGKIPHGALMNNPCWRDRPPSAMITTVELLAS